MPITCKTKTTRCTYTKTKQVVILFGKDCVSKLFIKLNELAEQCIAEMKNNGQIFMSDDDYDDCQQCYTLPYVINQKIKNIR